jgi:hypothetical protein
MKRFCMITFCNKNIFILSLTFAQSKVSYETLKVYDENLYNPGTCGLKLFTVVINTLRFVCHGQSLLPLSNI